MSSPTSDPLIADLRRAARVVAMAHGWSPGREVGVDGDPPGVRVEVSGGELGGRCVLRVCSWRGEESVDIAARRAARSEHVLGVRRVLVERVRRREVEAVVLAGAGSVPLESVLTGRADLRSGEAGTMLLGVAAGVAALHRGGWARPGLAADGVVLAGDGCPALDRLDEVVPYSPDAAVADAESFHALARTVCLRVTDGGGMALLAAVEAGLRRGSWAAVEEAVLAVAAPEPVRVEERDMDGGVAAADVDARERAGSRVSSDRSREPGRMAVAWRSGLVAPASRSDAPASGLGARPSGPGSSSGGTPPPRSTRWVGAAEAILRFLDGEPARDVWRRIGAWVRRRPALVVVAAVPLAVALGMVALLPATASPQASAADVAGDRAGAVPGVPTVTPSATPLGSGATPAADTLPNDRSSARANEGAASGEAVTGTATAAGGTSPADLRSPDPMTAVGPLLRARHACFSSGAAGPSCLDALLDASGPLAAEDAQAMSVKGAASSRDYEGARLTLVERWGDAALVGVAPDRAKTPNSEPASLLLVRSEAGWRLRAVFP